MKYYVYEKEHFSITLKRKFSNKEDAIKYVNDLAYEYVNNLKDCEEIDKYKAEDIMWYVRKNEKDIFELTEDYELRIVEVEK